MDSLSTDLAVARPPVNPVRRPPVVLDEDTYTDALSRIIARDFFPGLDDGAAAAAAPTLSLSAFQSRYTSEDNESFNRLIDRQNASRRRRLAWRWSGNSIPSTRLREERRRIAAANSAAPGLPVPVSNDLDARPARPDGWQSTGCPENTLMFAPGGDAQNENGMADAEAASRAPLKQVFYQNTRLPPPVSNDDAARAVPPSPSLSALRDVVRGQPSGDQTPGVDGYSFVDEDEPAPPLPSSSSIPSTPTANPFSIRPASRRETLHHRIVERASRARRLTPASPFAGSRTPLTPAAQRLLARVGGATPRAVGGGSDRQLEGGNSAGNLWTPTATPRRRRMR